MRMRAFAFLATTALLAGGAASLACGDENLMVGSGPLGGPEGGSEAPPDASGGAEIWSGYIERFTFLSGSDRVTLTLTTPTTGTVVFGQSPASPPPIDPAVGYPPGYSDPSGAAHHESLAQAAERFGFTIMDAIRDPDRIRFTIDLNEMVAPWCREQKLIVINQGSTVNGVFVPQYDCAGVAPVPDSGCAAILPLPDGGVPDDMFDASVTAPPASQVAVDCTASAVCRISCICTHTSCDRGYPYIVKFDLHVSGATADGDIAMGKVRLTKQ